MFPSDKSKSIAIDIRPCQESQKLSTHHYFSNPVVQISLPCIDVVVTIGLQASPLVPHTLLNADY